MNSISQCIDRLKRRRWEHLRSKWINHIPHFSAAGKRPNCAVSEVFGFDEIARSLAASSKSELERAKAEAEGKGKVISKGVAARGPKQFSPNPKLQTREEELSGVREAVFEESLFLLHKGRHVLGATEHHIQSGIQTWSLANAYQGAFFAAKAILGFLGISFAEFDSKVIVIDLFPNPVTTADQYNYCAFHYLGLRLDHRPIWEIFQRMLGISSVDLWPERVINKLKSIETKYFARQRNEIHYKNNGWILDDLHKSRVDLDFGASDVLSEGLDFAREDISVGVALAVVKLGLLLIEDLEKSTSKLTPELNLIAECIDVGRHPIYGAKLLSNRSN